MVSLAPIALVIIFLSGWFLAASLSRPPILTISKRAYGYDHREAQMKPFYSRKYQAMQAKALSGANS